jgi:hypothetical protein
MHISIDPCGIEPAHEICTLTDRLIKQIACTRMRNDTTLRESDDLDVQQMPDLFSHPKKGVQPLKANVLVDVNMAADRGCPIGSNLADEFDGSRLNRQRKCAPQHLLSSNSLRYAPTGTMRLERQAEQCLVEVKMAID